MFDNYKFKLRKFDYIVWVILLILIAINYSSPNSIVWLILTSVLILYIGIWFLRVLLMTLGKRSSVEKQNLSNADNYDTSNWIKCKGIIVKVLPGDDIAENGKIVERLFDFKIKLEEYDSDHPMIHETYIKDVPISTGEIFNYSINTQVGVLVDPKHPLSRAVFDKH